jgi:hypothetical protein
MRSFAEDNKPSVHLLSKFGECIDKRSKVLLFFQTTEPQNDRRTLRLEPRVIDLFLSETKNSFEVDCIWNRLTSPRLYPQQSLSV